MWARRRTRRTPIDRGPPAVDCRKPIQVPLPADDDAQDKGKDADFGIEDVRVSRNHIRVARKVGGAPTLTVLAPTNPVAYCEANSNERQLLTKGQVCELADGDQVRLVVEDHVKAEGNSEKFAGNPCAYQVHLYRRGVRLSAERRAAAKRVRRSSGPRASPRPPAAEASPAINDFITKKHIGTNGSAHTDRVPEEHTAEAGASLGGRLTRPPTASRPRRPRSLGGRRR